jgi:hypothetical protein
MKPVYLYKSHVTSSNQAFWSRSPSKLEYRPRDQYTVSNSTFKIRTLVASSGEGGVFLGSDGQRKLPHVCLTTSYHSRLDKCVF